MRDRLIELLEEAKTQALATTGSLNHGFGEWYADYLLANGVIVTPCKVGDTIFLVSKDTRIFDNIKFVVNGFEIRSDGDNTYRAICTMNDNLIPMTFGDDNIGKTVFLTKELAEEALKNEQEKL